jgi:hypothetical protein
MRRFIVLLAAAIPVAATIGMATVVVGSAPDALASNCTGPYYVEDFFNTSAPQYWDAVPDNAGQYEASETANVVTSPTITANMYPSLWCKADGTNSNYNLFRLKDTSLCATWNNGDDGIGAAGEAQGVGWVDLQSCSTGVAAENWTKDAIQSNGELGLTTEYQVENGVGTTSNLTTSDTCLSAYNLTKDPDDTNNLVMVNGCDGDGGQSWEVYQLPT